MNVSIASIIFSYLEPEQYPICKEFLKEEYNDDSYLEDYIRKNVRKYISYSKHGTCVIEYKIHGCLHNIDDLPATEVIDDLYGRKEWYQYGKIYRDNDSPTTVFDDGIKMWFKYNELYRDEELPNIISDKKLNSKRKLHRENDLPAIEFSNGDKHWYINNKLHRDNNLPAIEYKNGTKKWYTNGKHTMTKLANGTVKRYGI